MKLTRTRKRLLGVAVVAALLGGGGAAFAATDAPAGAVFSDTSVTADHQRIDAITAIDAAASWAPFPPGTAFTTPTFLGSAITVTPVPSLIHVQFTAHGSFGTPTWTIVSENNIPAGVLIGLNPASGLLTVQPPTGPVIAANNQDITLTVKVTDGAATAFETLDAKPIIVSSVINAIDTTAVTDAVTLAGFNNNVTGAVDFTSTPAGAAFSLANSPAGTALNAGHLAGTSAIPSTEDYTNVSVTATDAMGATAVDTFKLDVFGAVSGSDIPRLSGGRATEGINASRENVSFIQNNAASCDHFTIVGPGPINGHQGWVPGNLGLNVAVYGGLLQHHGYTVYYQPVSGPLDCSTHSTTPWPGAHWGYVFFVTA